MGKLQPPQACVHDHGRIDTPTRDDDENVSDNSDTSDDADPNGRQEKAQEHKKARTDS